MTSIRKVLFPINPRFQSRMPVRYGVELAARVGAELGFVHVVRRTDPETWRDIRAVEEVVNSLTATGTNTWSVVVPGDPSTAIADYAAGIGADLIILGARDRFSLAKVLFGSTTRAVMARARCPVLVSSVTHCDPDKGFACRQIVCATSFSEDSRQVIAYAASLAEKLKSGLTFVHVVPEISEGLVTASLYGHSKIVLDPAAAREKLCEMISGVRVSHSIAVVCGDVGDTLKKHVRLLEADLMIVGRRRGPASGVLESLAGSAPCAVISVPSGLAPAPVVLPSPSLSRLILVPPVG
jgi:nucleotide-binding universal stress UspA family protein